MSTLRATNIKNPDSGSNNIVLSEGGGVVISGVTTVSNANITGGSITGISTVGVTTVTTTNLTVNGNAYPTAGSLSNRNLIINGDMQVAQRGTSSTSSGYYTVDRWFNISNGGSMTHSQENLSSGSPYDEGFRKYLRSTNTTASTAASTYRIMQQSIEAQNIAQSGWNYTSSSSYITLSFWVRSSVSQNFYSNVNSSDGTIQMYPFETGVLAADTWTKIVKRIPGNSNITIDNDNGTGLSIAIAPFYGTDRTDNSMIVDSWQTFASNNRSPDYDTTWASTTNATFDFTGVQLEVGEVATPFEHRSYGDELARCMRYYQVITGWGFVIGSSSTTQVRTGIRYSPPMRDVPSFSLSKALKLNSPGSSETSQSSAAVSITGQSGSSTQYGAILSFSNFSGLTSQQAYVAPWDNTQLFASAEL